MSYPSPKALQQMFRLRTSAEFPALLKLVHESLDGGVIRLANADRDLTYNGEVYQAADFKYQAPKYSDKKMGDGSLTISCIDQSVIEIIRKLTGRPSAVVVAAFYFEGDETLFEPIEEWSFKLALVTWNETAATWTMKFDTRLQNQTPFDSMSARKCPGIA